jgi:estrone sulfotransferase
MTRRVGLCSYPKSGNTWVRFMIANIMEVDRTVDYRNINEIIPTGAPTSKSPEATLAGWQFYKTHLPIGEAVNIYDRVIYIARDGFDALESYRWFLQKQHPRLFRGDADFLLGHRRFYGYWGEHYNREFDGSKSVHVVRYEDLKNDSRSELSAVLEFLDVDVVSQTQKLDTAILRSSRERMKALPGSAEFMKAASNSTNFVRRGESGKGLKYWTESGFLSQVMMQPGFLGTMERFSYAYPEVPAVSNNVGVWDSISFHARDFARKVGKTLK